MIATPHHNQIARVVPSPRLSIGRPAISSLGRAATFNHSERQRSSGTALGLRWGMYRTTCAVGTTGRRFAGLGCHRRGFEFPAARGYDLLTRLGGGFGPRPFGQIDGIGAVAAVPFANLIRNTADHPLHNAVEPFKRHFSASVRYVPKPKDGAIGIDQNPIGASQNVNDC